MTLKKHLMVCSAAVALTGGTAVPATAAPWVKGFVVGAYEYAFRYGGRPDFSRGAEIEPGVDCPHGSTIHFANDDADQDRGGAPEMALAAGDRLDRQAAGAG